MEVKPAFMVLECTTVYPGTKKSNQFRGLETLAMYGHFGAKNWRQ